jgi:hypothetical protein
MGRCVAMCSESNLHAVVGREINGGRGDVPTQIAQIFVRPRRKICRTRPWEGDFCSKFRAPHRGTFLSPFLCGANDDPRKLDPNP